MLGNQSKTTFWRSTILENYVDFDSLSWIPREPSAPASLFEHNARLWMSIILLGTDWFCLSVAVLMASQLHHISSAFMNPAQDGIFAVLGVTMAILFYRNGLYPTVGMHYVDEMRYLFTSSTVAFLLMIAVTFVFQIASLVPVLVLAGMLNVFLIPMGRYFVRRLFIDWKLWGEPVAMIGNPDQTQALTNYFKVNLQLGIRPVVVLSDPIMVQDRQWLCPSLPICRLKLFVRNLSLKTVLVLIDDLNDTDRLVERYRFVFQRVILIKEQNGSYGLASLRSLDFLNMLGLEVKNDLLDPSSQVSKRVADLVISSLGIIFLAPVLGLIALLIKLDSRGDVFYRQPRLGRNGRVFQLLKFRTMHQNADQIFKDSLSGDPELKREWDCFQKLKHDPRVTRVGKFLRKFSLDEVPQLWNVWKGEMSLAGPRPIMVDQRKLYGESIKLYIRVAPGMTGLWQISGRNETTFRDRAALDIEYIQRWSHWLDIYILFKTIKVVFWQKGAY